MSHRDDLASFGRLFPAGPGAVSPVRDAARALLPGVPGPRKILAQSLVDVVMTWHERSRQRRALQGSHARLLRDMGISQAELLEEVAKPFWRA